MHNDDSFGSYEVKAPPSSLNTKGRTWYNAEITSAAVARDAMGNPVTGKTSDDTKTRVDVTFTVIDVRNEYTGNAEELKSRYTISYGQSNAGPWSRFAQFITSVTKIPCGDARQKKVGPKQLIGKKVCLLPILSDTGYVNVKEVGEYDPSLTQPLPVRGVTTQSPPQESSFTDDGMNDSELPF